MLKTTGLIAGHYECRSLAETLPVFTDLSGDGDCRKKIRCSHTETSEHRLAIDCP